MKSRKRLRGSILAALLLTVCGLAHMVYLGCSVIRRGWPAYASDYVEARGFPLAWMVSGNQLCAASLRWWQRFLFYRFSLSYVATLLLTFVILTLAGRAFRRTDAQSSPEGNR